MPADLNHQTIAGPDMWVALRQRRERVDAAWKFLKWFTSHGDQVCRTRRRPATCRPGVGRQAPGFQEFGKKFPGNDVFAENLANVTKARPVAATYPKISTAVGQAVVAVMLGKAIPRRRWTRPPSR